MIIVDNALAAREREGRPIRVAMVGAGFMGRGIANQIENSTPGMTLVAIANRRLAPAIRAYSEAGIEGVKSADSARQLDKYVAAGLRVVTDDPDLLCSAGLVDALIEVTGSVEYGARVALAAISHGKPLVLMNAELDGTIGPVLQRYAAKAGVTVTGCDGDQPGVQMNLFRFVRSIGLTPLVCGNIKGLHDPYRNPTTQEGFARQWGQKATMVTSFADGTKISFEQAIVANATGMRVARRGMLGREHTGHVDELAMIYDLDELESLGGIVDYVVGAKPGPGVFVLGTHPDRRQRHYLDLYKLGKGPLYNFYTPYHLCHFEVPISVARAVIFADHAIAPLEGPMVDVIATAKKDLKVGTVLDQLGGYTTYGQCENADLVHAERFLPIGLAEGCRVKREIARDQILRYEDVEVPSFRVADRLRAEQDAMFWPR